MPTDDTPSTPTRRRFGLPALNSLPVAAIGAALALVVGFGGGFAAAKLGDSSARPAVGQAGADQGPVSSFFGKLRAATAPRRGVPKPDGFAVWRSRVDTTGAQPLACVELTRDLDPGKSYGDFVLVSPDLGAPPAVQVKGAELCVAGLGFNDRRVTLLKGLPAKGGEALAANADIDFTFGEKPPYVGFAGDGVILPRSDSDGVGIETVNVSRLSVEVWRVSDRNLVRVNISAPDPTAEGEYAYDYGDDSPDQEGARIWKGEVAVAGEAGQKVTTVFPLGAVLKSARPGGYVIKVRDASGGRTDDDSDNDPPAQARRWVMFTDMALISYSGSDGLDASVRSLKSAKPLGGTTVALVAANGEELATAKADAEGRVRFAKALLGGEGGLRAKMLMAYGSEGDLAVLDLDRSPVDLSKQGIGGRTAPGQDTGATSGRTAPTQADGFLYADRGIYRPGETVHLAALIRDRQAVAIEDRRGTIVVRRPSGVEFKRIAFDKSQSGAVTADLVLPKSAPRGRWTAALELEGMEGSAGDLSFSVEDFAPQRLAVTATGQEQAPVRGDEARAIAVSARFLYGAAGAGLQTQGEARLSVDHDPFPAFDGYQWGDPTRPFEEKYVDLGSTVTDGEGAASLSFPGAEGADAAQPLKALVTASVFEPGGRPVREGLALKVRAKSVYFGVKVNQAEGEGGRTPAMSFDLIAVDPNGRRIAAQAEWTLISENWDYDWFQQDGRWQWRRNSRDAVIARSGVAIGAGDAAKIGRRLEWGDYRLEVTGADGARTVVRFSAGWGAPAGEADAPDFVRLTAGTRAYAQGDTVEITLKSPYEGEAQVAVATDRVIDMRNVSVGRDGATLRLKTDASWGGGAYVLVSVIQPRDPVASPKPRRAIGLVYVPLDPKGRKLVVDVGTPAKLPSKAELEVPIRVDGLGFGQRAHVTVAAVDEGILRLTKFETPDPVKWYFGKRALTVDYRDDYGRLLDPNLGAPANVNFGGDEIGGEGLTVTPIRTVALWSGVVETGLDGRATVKLPAPDFNGELRIMAVAWTDKAVGGASKALVVREPVIAELNLPRFLAPGDRALATLELHNLEGRAGQYLAEITASGGVLAPFKKAFDLIVGQRIAERLEVTAPNRTGIGSVGFKVSGPGFETSRDLPIQTRIGWGPITRTTTELQAPGAGFTPAPQLLSGLAAGDISLQVSYSPFRGFDPAPVALALSRYPYGCTEQIVSAAYPLLYAQEVSTDPKLKTSPRALSDAVGRLLDRQTLDGAFGLWRVGDGEADAWLGAYATDFLISAQKQGAPVPQAAVDKALSAMRQISRPDGWSSVAYRLEYPPWWSTSQDASRKATERMRSRASAYALYVLAKGGRGDLARLRWWHDIQMKNEASPLAKAQIGAGLAMMGDKARARSALRQAARSLNWRDGEDWYQSPLRDLAAVIALAYEAGEPDIARGLQARLEGAVRDPDSLNTQEQARLLQAAHYMLAAAGPIQVEATGASALAAAGGTPRWAVGKLADARFVNRGSGGLWRTVTVRGTPVQSPDAFASGLSVSKQIFGFTGGAVDPAGLRQGDRVIVRVSGRSQQSRSLALVVDDALPAGFEIETLLGPGDAQEGPFRFLGTLTYADVQEARDDRFVAALDLGGDKEFAFAYVARAVTPGDFYLPGAEARDMYRPAVSARSAGSRTVIAAGP